MLVVVSSYSPSKSVSTINTRTQGHNIMKLTELVDFEAEKTKIDQM